MPTSMIAAISSEVATGRRINGRDGLTGHWSRRRGCRQESSAWHNGDLGAVLQFLEAAVGHHVAIVQSLHGGHARLGHARLDVVDVGHAVLDEEDERGVSVVLNGGGGDQDLVVQSVQQQAGVDEEVGEERRSSLLSSKTARSFSVPVVVSIWLSVLSKACRSQLGLLGAVVGVDRQRFALAHLLLQLMPRCLRGW